MNWEVKQGDCREVMATLDAESVDAIVSDPPYGLSFMGKGWDHSVPGVEFWEAALRVAKPGAHLLAFGGTRLFHRLAVAIEDAGWEIRDTLMWVYGSGFPKSANVSKLIDNANGCTGGKGPMKRGGERLARLENGKRDGEGKWGNESGRDPYTYVPEHPLAQKYDGWGTALKPAWEPIIMARKPLIGTVAANFEKHGTGGLNIDGCRVEGVPRTTHVDGNRVTTIAASGHLNGKAPHGPTPPPAGRWPSNLIHDGSEEATEGMGDCQRYFYCAKASKSDRDEGLDEFEERLAMRYGEKAQGPLPQQTPSKPVAQRNHHPTVKPTDLMAYLCRLVTPKGGIVLDPFCGSGSTGKAAVREGFDFIGIELDPEYADIARARIEHETTKAELYA